MIPYHSGMVSMLLYFGYLLVAFARLYFNAAAATGSTAAGGAAAARANIAAMGN